MGNTSLSWLELVNDSLLNCELLAISINTLAGRLTIEQSREIWLVGVDQGRRKQFGFGTAKWDNMSTAEGSV